MRLQVIRKIMQRQDIKEILIVLLLAAIAVSISEGAEYYFYEYLIP